jgi:MFS family permease
LNDADWSSGRWLVGSGLTAFTAGNGTGWLIYFYATRFVAGMGIGGEYSAINSAIDEMMPSRDRGRVDIWINGTYSAGAILASFVSFVFLNACAPNVGWRLAFLMGAVLALVIIVVRRNLPESPRWLVTHGRQQEAEASMALIEDAARHDGQVLELIDEGNGMMLLPEKQYGYLTFLRLAFRTYPKRAILGASLMITVIPLQRDLLRLCHRSNELLPCIPGPSCPLYGLAFSIGNLADPLILGHLFDTFGRKFMIAGTYILSGALLAGSAWLFHNGTLNAATQIAVWVVIIFFASAGASAAYLTVSETWPIEIRAEAIAVFFAIAQIFGALGPVVCGALIGSGSSRTGLTIGYVVGGSIMILGGLVEVLFGIYTERRSLESITPPLTAVAE